MDNPYSRPGLYNADCMEAMKHFPDGFFDLAVVDPPYGDAGFTEDSIGGGEGSVRDSTGTKNMGSICGRRTEQLSKIRKQSVHAQRNNCRKPDGTWGCANWRNVCGENAEKIVAWDVAPKQEYFQELFRISRNQIIWGGNYFDLPPCRCFLIWRKLSISEQFSMAMAEYAWTSFNSNAKVFECAPQGTAKEVRFHPTQKPIALYSWILGWYAKPGDKILDTHAGSASSLVACYRQGFDAWGFEIDKGYYNAARKRLADEMAQMTIWTEQNDMINTWEV